MARSSPIRLLPGAAAVTSLAAAALPPLASYPMTAVLDQPQTTQPPAQEDYYVILSTAAGRFTRGTVVSAGELGDSHVVTRLMSNGAVRTAYPAERGLRHVDLPAGTRDVSLTQVIADKDMQIRKLHQTMSELQAQISAAHPDIGKITDAGRIQTDAVIKIKDNVITDLQNRVRELEEQNANQRSIVAENISLKNKLSMMEQGRVVTQQANDKASVEDIQRKIAEVAAQNPGIVVQEVKTDRPATVKMGDVTAADGGRRKPPAPG
jgi:TusA-related sulfurtransferase